MSQIVLVHGIGQTQEGADTQELDWIGALASGIRKADHPDLADAIGNRPGPGLVEARMAHYADLFQNPLEQGAGMGAVGLDDTAEEFAAAILASAACVAPDPRDRADAARAIKPDDLSRPDQQGWQSAIRPGVAALAELRWFAPMAVRAAGRAGFLTALREVPRYLDDVSIRAAAQDRVLALITPETRLVIGHSLGSVVAYEALHRLRQRREPLGLITLGSPLGLGAVIYCRLAPNPASTPEVLTSWHNFADKDDIVAARARLNPLFPPAASREISPVDNPHPDNGAKPHDASHYLCKRSVGEATAAVLAPIAREEAP